MLNKNLLKHSQWHVYSIITKISNAMAFLGKSFTCLGSMLCFEFAHQMTKMTMVTMWLQEKLPIILSLIRFIRSTNQSYYRLMSHTTKMVAIFGAFNLSFSVLCKGSIEIVNTTSKKG